MSDPLRTPDAPTSRSEKDVAARWVRWQTYPMTQHALTPEAAARGYVVGGELTRLAAALVALRPPATRTEPPAAPDAGHAAALGVDPSDERGR